MGNSDFNNTGAIPRAQSNAASGTGGYLPARHPMHGDVAPPGLAPSFYFPMPQMNSGSFTSANGIGAPSNESKLFAALNGNLRRNPEVNLVSQFCDDGFNFFFDLFF